MRRLLYLIITATVLVLTACDNSIRSQMQLAEDLIMADQLDSALTVISDIDTAAIVDDADRAHYYLLNTRLRYCLYKPIPNIGEIRWATDYYENHGGDSRLYGNALYYRAMIESDSDKITGTTQLLKKAEELALESDDIHLLHKVYDALSTVNFIVGNYPLAAKYTNLALDCAGKTGNPLWYAYGYSHLACLHNEMGNTDSAGIYIRKCLPYTQSVDSIDRAQIFALMGDYYINTDNLDLAGEYLRNSYDLSPSPGTCNRLAFVYNKRGDKQKAHELWDEALKTSTAITRSQILETISGFLYDEGNADEAYKALRQLVTLRDSLSRVRETTAVSEMQLKYDQQSSKRRYDKILIRALYGLIVLILLVAAYLFYHQVRSVRAKRKIMSDQILINDYRRKINDLQHSGSSAAKEISRLQDKIDQIQNDQASTMYEGRKLYESIEAGRSVVTWPKSDIAKFIEYYKAINLSFVMQMEHDYSGLTDNNRLFLILQEMGKGDAEISQITGTSAGAVRTARSRLRAKAREKSE